MTLLSSCTRAARISAAVIALLACGSVLLQIGLNLLGGEPLAEALWRMSRFFTILTNLIIAATFAVVAGGRSVAPRWLLAMTAAIAGVGIVYHALLSHLLVQVGAEIIANHGVHTVVPILSVIWFAMFAPVDGLRWRDTWTVVIWPVLYCVYILARGSVTGMYPYPFIDANTLSPVQMAINIAGLTLFFLALGLLLVGMLRLRGRKSAN
ncbi:Pr6Pr family membrane protein [Aurantiacibacter marinus]|uniref:Integral membrane protein n=1 Tax=Aurantiacibacter marinus TaxID=874156 RepID=A0A0H0XVY6_9SPHN|nr:Pr6Pr family membrane protein [Aurantiacibacter marinus]KLI64440.1 hypothetical protein AAV99_02235 [Aurantiacibacter marinus]